ncbi:N-6 DNA methylase [Haloarcula quadrata]|uniref:N-6 DNA methylase n=1 Tax=Haloarcula quadrata TaxID=182779 RepID=A0A495R511_9EURY|nr:N-6 DNA methylase [Haloarcula quadrata]RKS82114.1 N-6 DNA methylase [Haloarcula quadrata]
MVSEQKRHGQTYTPESVSHFLTNWAIRGRDDTILEPSVGEGRFVFDSYNRLLSLGADEDEASESIYGLDIDEDAVETLQKTAQTEFNSEFFNVSVGNLFNADLPEVDALVGNPPYVIRHRFENPEEITEQFSDYSFSDQADLYCYFLVRATQFLKPGGRMAMIVSNSWMKRKYGEEFKKFLLNEFHIHALIGFQERVFDDLANTVCIVAEKRPNTIRMPAENDVQFIQAQSPDIFNSSRKTLDELSNIAVQSSRVPQRRLGAEDYWDIWLRAPHVFTSIKDSDKFTTLDEYATPSIGVQTLHKDFYVLDNSETIQIEDNYLKPIAYSPRDHQEPSLHIDDCKYQLFWCAQDKGDLEGTNALDYIEKWENRTIEKRYSDETYDGLHNKTRIKDANRNPWYNLIDEAKRRLPSQILLPRRVYENYTAVWNPDGVVPNENFLATTVHSDEHTKPLLAYLNSQLGELNLRLAGQVYGGGVCDLNVSSSKTIQTINLDKLTGGELEQLVVAFDRFVETGEREVLDEAVYSVLGYTDHERNKTQDVLSLAIEESVNKG